MDYKYYYNNCMYNNIETKQVPNFEIYNIIAKVDIIYICIMDYSDLFLFNECETLLIANSRVPQTIVNQTYVYEKVLNNFAL